MRAAYLALSVLLAAAGVFCAAGFGEMIERSLPGSYHDSAPSVYASVGVVYGAIGVVLMLCALYLLSLGLGSTRRPPLWVTVAPLLVLAAFLPFARWMASVGYVANLLFGSLAAVMVAVLTQLLAAQQRGVS